MVVFDVKFHFTFDIFSHSTLFHFISWLLRPTLKHHVVRDAVDGGIIRVKYVKSGEQHADVLTKAIDAKSFEKHARFLLNVR